MRIMRTHPWLPMVNDVRSPLAGRSGVGHQGTPGSDHGVEEDRCGLAAGAWGWVVGFGIVSSGSELLLVRQELRSMEGKRNTPGEAGKEGWKSSNAQSCSRI